MLHWPQIGCLRCYRRSAIIVSAVILLVGVFLVVRLLWREVVASRALSEQLDCMSNMNRMQVSLFMYNQQYGHLPAAHVDAPDGTRMHSWRALIRDQIDNLGFPYEYHEPWNGPNNSKLREGRFNDYACPSAPDAQMNKRLTNYFVIEGSNTLFSSSGTTSIINRHISVNLRNTILVAEAKGLGIEWLEPRDLDYNTMSFKINDPNRPSISSTHPQGAIVRMADGSVQFLNEQISPDVLKAMVEVTP
jgi:hypothetical protein